MYFDLTDEQRAFVETVEAFAAREIAPGAAERDRLGQWDAEAWGKMAQLGLLGLQFPEEYGGSGASVLTTAAAFQAFTAGGADAGMALSWLAHSVLAGTPLWLFGSEEQKRRYLRPIATGEVAAGFGLTEPSAGSDAASLRTLAIQHGDSWTLNGSKLFITNAPQGDLFVVFASEDRALGSRGITAFIVERDFPGFSTGRELDKMGNRGSPTGELILQDCQVPAENVLGQRRQGFTIAKAALEWERFLMMAHSVGTMLAILRDCAAYAQERHQFGKPIAEQPATLAKLAGMRLDASAGELFTRRVAWLKDQGRATPLESSACKLFCSAAVMRSAQEGVQLFGGYGYVRGQAVERNLRDARLASIGGGTTEIQRQVVGRAVLHGTERAKPVGGLALLAGGEWPTPSARDLALAVEGVAEEAKRSPETALAQAAHQTVVWTLRLAGQESAMLREAGAVATYWLDSRAAPNISAAHILLHRGRLYRKPEEWLVTKDERHPLLPRMGWGQPRLVGPGQEVDDRFLPAVWRLFLAAMATGMTAAALDRPC